MLPEVNRRAFFAALLAPFVARFLPKPKEPPSYAEYKAARIQLIRTFERLGFNPSLRVGDTIHVRKPACLIPYGSHTLADEYERLRIVAEASSAA